MNCKSCGAPLKREGAKFCSVCGAKQTEETVNESTANNANASTTVVKQRIYWNIKPGEIATRINEAEFINYDSMLGIIINDGTTAYIRSNGETIKTLSGGCYDFIDPVKLDEILNSRTGGLVGLGGNILRSVSNFIFGRRVGDRIEDQDKEEKSNLKSLDQVISFLQKNQLVSIVLKQDREFQLLFGENHQDLNEFSDFVPINIRTKYHNLSLGVRAFFQISDFNNFAAFYLSESNTVRTNLLAKMLTPLIKSVVQDCMFDVEMKDTRVSREACMMIESRLKTMDFHGIQLKSIVEISADNEDLERMHNLAREMYLSEQELDSLQRTNDFKNRLNSVVGEQQIREAKDEKDLYLKLQEINKDKLLSEEELRKFYIVLSREHRIFQAQSDLQEQQANDAINAALADMEKTGLLREEEINILKFQIQEREYQRGYSVKLMQLKDAIDYEKVRTGGDQEIKLQTLKSEMELIRTKDNYSDERFYKQIEQWTAKNNAELDFQKKQMELQNSQLEFAYNLAERGQRSQMERLMELERLDDEMEGNAAERRRKELEMQNEHEFRMKQVSEETIREREKAHQNMSAEQIAAQRIADLSPEAQEEYFRSLSAGKDLEQERKLREEQSEFYKQQNETIQRMSSEGMQNMQSMMNNMMNTMATMSGNMVQNRNEQKEEYQNELHRQQARHDMHQDQALNYTTRYPQSNTIIMPGNGDKAVNANPTQQQNKPQQDQKPQAQPQETAHQTEAKGMEAAEKDDKECPVCHKKYSKEDNFCSDCGCFI